MDKAELDVIENRWGQTTGGEWEAVMWIDAKGGAVWSERFPVVEMKRLKNAERTLEQVRLDLEFCAAAHQDIPRLIDEVEQLAAERDALVTRVAHLEAVLQEMMRVHGRNLLPGESGGTKLLDCQCGVCRQVRAALAQVGDTAGVEG